MNDTTKNAPLGDDTHQQFVRSCVSHHHACDCREQQFRELLALAQGTMEGWAHAEVLHEWHCRCEKLIGTAYPANTAVRVGEPVHSRAGSQNKSGEE